MASISSTISLYDRVTAPINNMLSALDNLCIGFEQVETSMNGSFDSERINQARQSLQAAAQQTAELGNLQDEYNRRIDESSSGLSGLGRKIMGLVGAYASMQGVKKLVNLSDEYVQTTARLNMIVDEYNDIETLQNKIFVAAQKSRSSYADTADMIAKLSLRTGKLFSNDEAVLFATNLNKLYTIAGASQQEMKASQLQLTQALGSGVLRGEEFNAVFEAAPNVMQQVADYMDVPIGKLRDMAADGKITASIVKNALLEIPSDVSKSFEDMPMTWAQVWTGVTNRLYMASQPLLKMISWLAQNWAVLEPIVIGLTTAIGLYTGALLINKGVQVASNIAKTIGTIKSIAHGAAITSEMIATTGLTKAQLAFNAALWASPLTWVLLIVIAVVAAFYAVIAAINKTKDTSLSATGMIVGALMSAVAFIWNFFLSLVDLVLGIINIFWNRFAAFANFFGNVFNDPIGSIIHLFGDMADNVLGILETIASAIDKLFGTELAVSVQGWRSGLDNMVEELAVKYGNGTYEEKVSKANLTAESLGLSRWAYTDAYNKGYSWGEGIGESISETLGADLSATAENTGETANALSTSNEELKYLREIAERDVVNRFTTAEIKVEMTNNNNVSSDMDLDGIVDYLVIGVNEAMEMAAEGVH